MLTAPLDKLLCWESEKACASYHLSNKRANNTSYPFHVIIFSVTKPALLSFLHIQREGDRQIDRQTDRWTDRHAERHREREKHI